MMAQARILMTARLGRRALPGVLVMVGLLSAGCGGTMSGAYVPPTKTAREALESALQAWQNGQKPDQLASAATPVNVADQAWQGGQKLAGFTIVSEDESDEARRFTVRLDLKEPRAQREVTYVVFGQGPIWVYRAEDYARMVNMDNNPLPAGRGNRRAR